MLSDNQSENGKTEISQLETTSSDLSNHEADLPELNIHNTLNTSEEPSETTPTKLNSQSPITKASLNQSEPSYLDDDATPTRETAKSGNIAGRLDAAVAPLAKIDSECGTVDDTPKHHPTADVEFSDAEDNELLIVEEGDMTHQTLVSC